MFVLILCKREVSGQYIWLKVTLAYDIFIYNSSLITTNC